MKKNRFRIILFACLLPLATGMLSAFLSAKGMDAYGSMRKPPFSPPAWVFSVAWTILYLLMGVASALIITSAEADHRRLPALLCYIIQLAMNFCWSVIFFRLEWYLFAFIWLLTMWLFVLVCTFLFWGIRRIAGILMIPYNVWLLFAGYLNLGAYVLRNS